LRTLGHAVRLTEGTAAAAPYWRDALALFTEIGTTEAEELLRLTASG